MGNGNVRKAKPVNNIVAEDTVTEQPRSSSSTEQTEHQLTIDNSENSKAVIDLESTSLLQSSDSPGENGVHPAAAVEASNNHSPVIPTESPSAVPSAPPPVILYPPGQPQLIYPAQPVLGQPHPSYAAQSQSTAYAPLPGSISDGGQPWPAPVQAAPPLEHHGPHIPTGYNILDTLQGGNVIQLICKTTNKPLTCVKGSTNANGVFGKDNSTFTVVVPKGAADGVVMLHNTVASGLYLSVNKGGFFNVGQGHKWSHLQPIVQPDNSVSFKSVEWGGLVCFNQKGAPAKASSQQDPGSQFHIRIEKQMNLNSQQITTSFGRPSIANFNQYNQYLSIDRTGAIVYAADGNDTETCFRLLDRGMGKFSFQSQKHKTLQLSMVNNVFSAKGGVSGHVVDFQLKENENGTVCFESVNCPGAYIGIKNGVTVEINLNMAVVTITGIGRNLTINKTYLN